MTRHLLRLIWNRKRQNFLLTLEIFFSFLTLFGVVLFAMQYANNARQPLGYEIDRVWSMTVDRKETDRGPGGQGAASRDLSPAAHGAARPAAGRGGRRRRSPARTPTRTGAAACASPAGGTSSYGVNSVTDDLPRAVADPARRRPLVLARRRRGDVDAGRAQPAHGAGDLRRRESDRPDHQGGARPERPAARSERQARGQAGHRRGRGLPPERRALAARELPVLPHAARRRRIPRRRCPIGSSSGCAPGTPAAFEETLVKRAMAVAGDWSFEVAAARRDARRQAAPVHHSADGRRHDRRLPAADGRRSA